MPQNLFFYSLCVNLIKSAIFSNFTIEHLWPPSKVHFLRALLGAKFSWKFVMSVWACYFREIWLLSDVLVKIQLIYNLPFFVDTKIRFSSKSNFYKPFKIPYKVPSYKMPTNEKIQLFFRNVPSYYLRIIWSWSIYLKATLQ